MKRFLTIGLLAVIIFGAASLLTIKTGVYGPSCAEERQAQSRGLLPKITNGVSMTGWPLPYVVVKHNENCQNTSGVFWNAAGLAVDLMVSIGLGAMAYVTVDSLNDWVRSKRVAAKD